MKKILYWFYKANLKRTRAIAFIEIWTTNKDNNHESEWIDDDDDGDDDDDYWKKTDTNTPSWMWKMEL